jgi:hypothetical protein
MNPHFATLVLGLAHQAESALNGQLPPGAEQIPGAAPKQIAQAMIDTLTMLEEKTQGRLEGDEAKLLTDALTALRFRFVKGPGPSE